MSRLSTVALFATAMVANPVAAKSLTAAPAQLDPVKAYVLVEIDPATDKMPAGSLVFARYDEAKGDVRGLGRAKDGALPGKALPRETTGKPLVKDGKRRLYLLELEPDF